MMERRGGHPQDACCPTRRRFGLGGKHFAARDFGARTQPQPGDEVIGRFPPADIGADFRDQRQGTPRFNPVNRGQVDARDAVQVRAGVEAWLVMFG